MYTVTDFIIAALGFNLESLTCHNKIVTVSENEKQEFFIFWAKSSAQVLTFCFEQKVRSMFSRGKLSLSKKSVKEFL